MCITQSSAAGLITMRQANAVSQSRSLIGPVGSSDPLDALFTSPFEYLCPARG